MKITSTRRRPRVLPFHTGTLSDYSGEDRGYTSILLFPILRR